MSFSSRSLTVNGRIGCGGENKVCLSYSFPYHSNVIREDLLLPRISLNAKSGKSLIPIGGSFRRYVIKVRLSTCIYSLNQLLKGIIGRGGYGEIYYAFDPKQHDYVALKIEGKMRRGKLAKRTILEQKVRIN